MLKSPLLFSISVLGTLLSWTSVAKANDARNDAGMALSFALPPVEQVKEKVSEIAPPRKEKNEQKSAEDNESLSAPMRSHTPLRPISAVTSSEGISRQPSDNVTSATNTAEQDSIGVQFLEDTLDIPRLNTPRLNTPKLNIPGKTPAPQQTATGQLLSSSSDFLNEANLLDPPDLYSQSTVTYEGLGIDDWIFEGGSKSLVAHTVGSAEGTRHWSGKQTKAYYGHIDPGNGVWNLGTFSYQHDASSPEDADYKQLKRLKSQSLLLEEQASKEGIQLSLREKLNGLDLANQAPLAALGEGGYIERLAQAYRLQLTEEEAIAWARTRAYIDPDTQTWNAPGLGNNLYSISRDQERRMAAIDKAFRAYEQVGNTALELAKLESIQLEGAQIEGTGLARTAPAEESFSEVTEAFKLAAHDISVETEPAAPTIDTLAAAVTFDLPYERSPEPVAEQLPVEPVAVVTEPIITGPIVTEPIANEPIAEEIALSDEVLTTEIEQTNLQAPESQETEQQEINQPAAEQIQAASHIADMYTADMEEESLVQENERPNVDKLASSGAENHEDAIALTFSSDQTHLLENELNKRTATAEIAAPTTVVAEEPAPQITELEQPASEQELPEAIESASVSAAEASERDRNYLEKHSDASFIQTDEAMTLPN